MMRWYRSLVAGTCAIVTLFTLAGTVLAGGWAVTTLDALPEGGFQAGQTYRLGYTIRQHGQTPVNGAKTAITITPASQGTRHVFPGVADGQPGHYVAEVTFPSEGVWDWQVSQEPYAMQSLGTVTVTPAPAADHATGMAVSLVTSAPVPAWSGAALPLAALLLVGVVVWPLFGFVRRRHLGSEPHLARTR
jgi:hypothetical protein